MGFYYGSNSPPPEDKPGGWKETFLIIWAVFQVLALPLGILLGGLLGLFLLFWLFTISAWLGLGLIGLGLLALVVLGVWEARNPPEIG
jgi:hypothetical protein